MRNKWLEQSAYWTQLIEQSTDSKVMTETTNDLKEKQTGNTVEKYTG